jgi:hypothetical protein
MLTIWQCNIPLEVKIFVRMAVHDRIQSGVQLKKKKWSRPEECATCDKLETSDHILFQCPIAVFLRSFLRDALGWTSSPTNCAKFLLEFDDNCQGKKRKVTLVIYAGALWTIWKTRNDVMINKKVLSSPMAIVYRTVSLIKTWRPLLKMKLKPTVEEMLDLISANVH